MNEKANEVKDEVDKVVLDPVGAIESLDPVAEIEKALGADGSKYLDPDSVALINAWIAIALILISSLKYKYAYDGNPDMFYWVMHLVLWGQNLIALIIQRLEDTYTTRVMYWYSTALAFLTYWLGMPAYIVWFLLHSLVNIQKNGLSQYFIWGWSLWHGVTTIVMQEYASIALDSLDRFIYFLKDVQQRIEDQKDVYED